MLEYRRPQPEDFPKIVALQNKNLVTSGGFLATEFTIEQFKEMDSDLAVLVAVSEERLCGYLCTTTVSFNMKVPFSALMLQECEKIVFRGKKLLDYRFCLATPMCLDADYRGTDLFVSLCNKMLEVLSGRFEFQVTFASVQNHRSLNSIKKIGGEKVGEFKAGDRQFSILVIAPLLLNTNKRLAGIAGGQGSAHIECR